MSKHYSGRRIIKALERLGFYIVSTKGSSVKLRGIRFDYVQSSFQNIQKSLLEYLQSILKQRAIEFEELRKFIK